MINKNIIAEVLRDDADIGIEPGMTLDEVIESANQFLDNCGISPVVLFRLEKTGGWMVGNFEFVINKANPQFVKDMLKNKDNDDF